MTAGSSPSPRTRPSTARSPSTTRCGRARCRPRHPSREDAGGKGINVARVVAAAGVETLAVLPLAEDDPFDRRAARVARARTARARSTATCARTSRSPIPTASRPSSTCPARRSRPPTSPTLIDAVVDGVRGRAAGSCSPDRCRPGAGDRFYVDVIRAVRARWGADAPLIAVDTSGAALRAVVDDAVTRPDQAERRGARRARRRRARGGRRPRRRGAARRPRARSQPRRRSARHARRRTAPCSSTADGAWQATPPRIRVVSTVGAGDSSLAGYLLADVDGDDPADRLRRSVRYGAAAASLPGTQAPTPADLPAGEVVVRRLNT